MLGPPLKALAVQVCLRTGSTKCQAREYLSWMHLWNPPMNPDPFSSQQPLQFGKRSKKSPFEISLDGQAKNVFATRPCQESKTIMVTEHR